MEKLFYISNEEQVNEYERECGKISYRTLLERYTQGHMILCNNIYNIDENLLFNVEVGSLFNDEECEEPKDIYQYFIIAINEWEIEELKKYYNDEVIIAYSEVLENYVLCVDHFGTSWDYVLTDVEYTTDWEKYNQWKNEQR